MRVRPKRQFLSKPQAQVMLVILAFSDKRRSSQFDENFSRYLNASAKAIRVLTQSTLSKEDRVVEIIEN